MFKYNQFHQINENINFSNDPLFKNDINNMSKGFFNDPFTRVEFSIDTMHNSGVTQYKEIKHLYSILGFIFKTNIFKKKPLNSNIPVYITSPSFLTLNYNN